MELPTFWCYSWWSLQLVRTIAEQILVTSLKSETDAPRFQVTDFNLVAHDMPDKEKPSLIFFFSTDCSDCQKQFPVIQKLFDKYGNDVHFIGISRCESSAVIESYIRKHKYTFPIAHNGQNIVYGMFARQYIPRVYIVKNNIVNYTTNDIDPLTFGTGDCLLEALTK